MFISEFVEKNQTTIDTVKYYIKLKLLTPKKKHNWYLFTLEDEADFQQIVQLKSLGFSLDIIQQIKINHETNCGTVSQWEDNLAIIQTELKHLEEDRSKLLQREKLLRNVQNDLMKKIQGND